MFDRFNSVARVSKKVLPGTGETSLVEPVKATPVKLSLITKLLVIFYHIISNYIILVDITVVVAGRAQTYTLNTNSYQRYIIILNSSRC